VKAHVASLKFSPGHLSHIVAYAKLLSEIGYETKLLLHKDYEKLLSSSDFEVTWYPESTGISSDLLIFCNVSTENHILANSMREKGSKVIYLYHEPWDGLRQYLKEGWKQTLKASIAHYFSTKLLPLVDLVIVPSNYALKLYEKKDIKYNRKVTVIPLLFDDELVGEIDPTKKTHFSYIGHAIKGHAFDVFIEVIKHMYKNRIPIEIEIATRTDLTNLLKRDKELSLMVKDGMLKVTHGRPLTNEEINEAYGRSFCIWNVYRRSTQSGVLPKAFMFGTPVLASNIGSFPEYVRNGQNGFLVEENYTFDQLLELVMKIKQDIQKMSKNCRETFETTFYWKNYVNSELTETLMHWQASQ